jgi:hypothetical protein
MKVALFTRKIFTGKIVVKVITFCIILFHLLEDDCQSIPIFFVIFHKSFYTKFLNFFQYAKNSVYNNTKVSFFHLFA